MVREERTIEVTVISAIDLKKVKKFGREQKNYVSAYIYPARREITATDHYGGVNPIWNSTLKLKCHESDLHPTASSGGRDAGSSSSAPSAHEMTLEIYSHGGGLFHTPDKLVGTVKIPLQQVASAAKAGGDMPPFEVHLPTASREVQGSLNLSVSLGAKRELGEYEDISSAPLPSYSNQGAPSSTYPPASDTYPPTSSHPPSSPNPKTSAVEEDVVTGYPAPGYAFAPLGQMPTQMQGRPVPMQMQGQPRPMAGGPGPYAVYSPEDTLYQTRRERRRGGRRRRGGPIHLGIMVLHGILAPVARGITGRMHDRQSGAQNQADVSSSSSSQSGSSYSTSQQPWRTPDSQYGQTKGHP